MLTKIKNQRGFVLIEFVIALPLAVLMIYALAQMVIQTSKLTREQAAEYVLENEAHEILKQITRDARMAAYVKVREAVGGQEMDEIFFIYRVEGNNISKNYFKNKSYNNYNTPDIVDLYYTHRYTIGATENHGYQIYMERLPDGPKVNPISGGNFLADTVVTRLKFSQPSEKVLHITLEIKSMVTYRTLKLNTSVFMPACEQIEGL